MRAPGGWAYLRGFQSEVSQPAPTVRVKVTLGERIACLWALEGPRTPKAGGWEATHVGSSGHTDVKGRGAWKELGVRQH